MKMSQELHPIPEENNTPSPRRNRNNTWLFVGTILVLLGLNIYLFVNRGELSREKKQMEQQFVASDSARQAVEGEYQAALVRLDELVTQNSELDSAIHHRNSEIAALRRQIEEIVRDKNATAANLEKARDLIAILNTTVRDYEEQIALLERENLDLAGTNEVLLRERDSTVTQNIALAQKVRLASLIRVSNIRMVPLEVRRGGKKLKETEKARRVDVLRISFDIDENRIAEDGLKEIFFRITGPEGKVLSNAAYGSGVTSTADGTPLNYTLAKQIQLRRGEAIKDVVVDWNQDSDYQRGNYFIEIFHNGHEVGSGQVELR